MNGQIVMIIVIRTLFIKLVQNLLKIYIIKKKGTNEQKFKRFIFKHQLQREQKKITNYLTNKELSIYEFLKWILTEKN